MFIPEHLLVLAGLLAYSFFGRLPILVRDKRIVAKNALEITEITAAGTVQDFHLVPYYPVL
jgi:hypothetical protein